jgi:hypothetical protein
MNYLLKSNEILKIVEKNIRINNIKSPKMLTLRFFFPSVYMKGSEIGPVPQTCPIIL